MNEEQFYKDGILKCYPQSVTWCYKLKMTYLSNNKNIAEPP